MKKLRFKCAYHSFNAPLLIAGSGIAKTYLNGIVAAEF